MQEELILLHRQTGLTTVFVTHDQEEALSLSDRVILLNGGRIEQEGAPKALYSVPRTRFAATFMGSTNLIDAELQPHGDGARALLCDGQVLLLRAQPSAKKRATIMFRQEDAILAPVPDNAALSRGAPIASVVTQIFLGARTRYVLDLGGHMIRCLAPAGQFYAVGDKVELKISPDSIHVLED